MSHADPSLPLLRRCLQGVAALITLVMLTGCGPATAHMTSHKTSHKTKGHRFLWSYHGRYDPSHWGEGYCACRGGRKQSPIDLRADRHINAQVARISPVALHLRHVLNNGHTVQVGVEHAVTLHLGKRAYRLLQLHFHTPAEHTLSGKRAPMEMHLVHRADNGAIAVVAVLFDQGAESLWLARLWQQLPSRTGQVIARDLTLPLSDVLGPWHGAYAYDGSLTTPPCSEGVRWFVLKGRQHASRAQITRIHKLIGDNNRPLQRRKGRHIDEQ